MLACKETAVLHFAALALAALCFRLWSLHGTPPSGARTRPALIAAGIVFLVVSVALFSWFGSDWHSLGALLHAAPNLLARASGEGHQKPVWYYARLLTHDWSGGLIALLACIGFFRTFRLRESSPFALLALYSIFLAAIYSLIPYKTPWLALNLWLPIALFAGVAVQSRRAHQPEEPRDRTRTVGIGSRDPHVRHRARHAGPRLPASGR